jgi:hypothetical protein
MGTNGSTASSAGTNQPATGATSPNSPTTK